MGKIERKVVNGITVEYGHTFNEYIRKYGSDYEAGDLWDFSKSDFEAADFEPQENMVYWSIIDNDGEERFFETNEVLEESCEKKNEEVELDEGTSNFGRGPDNFPLLVFYTIDEVYDQMYNDPDYPDEAEYEMEDENGHYYIDEDRFEEAKEKFEQEYWDKLRICVLDESELDLLESKLDDFNDETNNIANNLYDADSDDDYYALKDIELNIESGYYEAAYIDVDGEEQFEYMSEEVRNAQIERFSKFFDELKKEFGLTKLSAGPAASNGERSYSIIDDDGKEEALEEKKKKDHMRVATGFDLAKDTAMTNHMLGSDCCEDFDEYDTDSYYDSEDICVYQFPRSLTKSDLRKAKEYGLTYLGRVNDMGFQPKDHLVKGKYKDLKRYCSEYLDYVMHPYYLYKEEDIDLEDTLEPANESIKEEKEYLSDKVTQVLDDYGILYGDIVENGDGSVNIVGVDEEEWDEVVEAIKAELGLDVLVPDSDHDELDDELIVRESLKEDDDEVEYSEDDYPYDGVHLKFKKDFNTLSNAKENFDSVEDAIAYGKAHPDFEPDCVFVTYKDEDKIVHVFESLKEEKQHDGKCPYCHSENIDFVDSDEDSEKHVCHDCGQDFLVHNDGHVTTRNNRPIEEKKTDESLKESSEVARVEYCVMDNLNNNIECFDNTDDAIAFAKDNEGVRVLEVKYGPKNEHGDEPELSAEEVWSIRESLDESNKKFALVVNGEWYSTYDSYEKADEAREKFLDSCSDEDDAKSYYGECPNIEIKEIDESLNESMKSEVTKWWHDVEGANKEMQWGFNIDNGDGEDVESMHAAMFDMLDALKEKGAGELFKKGKKIYNKYAISKYNESLEEEKIDEAKLPYGVLAWKLNNIISAMNNENAYFESGWLYTWPDGETYEQSLEDFKDEESFEDLRKLFEKIYKRYHKDGLYTKDNSIVDYAHKVDAKLGLEPIENLYKNADSRQETDDPYDESLKESLKRYKIEYWVDEEARDQGFGDIAIETFDDLEDAKEYADKLFSDVASVEVLDTQDEDKVVYGRYPEDESMNESKETNERNRLKYLLDKEECCTLDKGERFELQNLIQKYGYPENESVITNDKNIDAIKDEVNPSDIIPQEEQDALAKGELIEESKSISAWSIKANPTNEEIEIYVKKNNVWEAIASVENCPTKDMLQEDIRKEYSKVAKQVIKESGYELDRKYGLYLEVKDANTGKVTKDDKPLMSGSKKECDEKKKQLEETSPEDSHGNKNKYIVRELK